MTANNAALPPSGEKNGDAGNCIWTARLDASAYCAEQINETLPAGPVKAEKLAGGEVRLLNRALAFDEVAK